MPRLPTPMLSESRAHYLARVRKAQRKQAFAEQRKLVANYDAIRRKAKEPGEAWIDLNRVMKDASTKKWA